MPVSIQNNPDLDVVTLLSLLAMYIEAEQQIKPYLIKDGIKIIL
jgi:hypothetical protein